MKFMLMMNAPGKVAYQIAKWPLDDIKAHIQFMKDFNKRLQKAGELVGAEGLAGPDQAKLVKADKNTEAGVMPSETLLKDMMKYNEELVKAGVLLAGEGLQPSSKGARVRFSGAKRTVIDGPFTETKELIAGFWMFNVKSKEEAIEWVKRCPNPVEGDTEIEIRQVFEAPDLTQNEDIIRKEAELRARSSQLAAGKNP